MGQENGAQNSVGIAMRKRENTTLITTEQLAERWKLSIGHLKNMRSLGDGPAFVRVAKRGVRYRLAVIEQWERAK